MTTYIRKFSRYLLFCLVFSVVVTCLPQRSYAQITFGNLHGSITLLEYFDYNCPVCRGYFPTINRLAHNNPDLLVIQRVVPALAPSSFFVDRALLASFMQGKLAQMQEAILRVHNPETIPAPQVLRIAKSIGLNMQQLQSDMQSPLVTDQIRENMRTFLAFGVHHIPLVEIYPSHHPNIANLFVGAQNSLTLQRAINRIRQRNTQIFNEAQGDHHE